MSTRKGHVGKYIVPSVASMLVTFLYIVVDGIFVGRGVGADALAAVNIALPFAALVTGLADLITMGGASVAAIRLGRGDGKGASAAFTAGMGLTLAVGLAISGVGMLFTDGISILSGANARLLPPTSEYLYYYCAFVLFVSMAICMATFVRNDGRPGLAFWGMIAGAAANIALDWVFIFPLGMGLKGAAIASGLGQILTVAILSTHFLRGRGELRFISGMPSLGLVAKIIKRGTPEFITQMSQPITILCFNYIVMRELGEVGVAAYAVVCYFMSLINAMLLGVAAGIQPLIGKAFGEKNRGEVAYYFRSALRINLLLAGTLYVVLLAGGIHLTGIFSDNLEIGLIAKNAMATYGVAYIVAAANILITILFFSTKRTGPAVLVAMARSCGLNIILIFAVPAIFGPGCIWMSLAVVEAATLALGLALMRRSARKPNSESVIIRREMAA